MPKSLGKLLSEKRGSRYLSLPEVELATRIKAEYLRALEEERFGDLPGAQYAEIYLREYARFLDLDPESLMDLFHRRMRWPRFWRQSGQALRKLWQRPYFLPVLIGVLAVILVAGLLWGRALIAGPEPAPVEKRLLLSYPRDGTMVAAAEIPLVGRVPAGAHVSVNDSPVQTQADGCFSHVVALEEGETHLRLLAWDEEGWREEREVVVLRPTATPLPTATPRPTLSMPATREEPAEYQVVVHQIDAARFPGVVAYFSVFDEEGTPWPALTLEHLTVEEDDGDIADFFFETVPVTEPLAIALVVDVSGSMGTLGGEPLEQAKAALRAFLENLNENDTAALIAFGNEVSLVLDFTTDKDALAQAVDALQAEGETALYDAVLFAAEQVAAQPSGRRAVIVLTDGRDTVERHSLDEAIDRALILNVPVYALGLESEEFDGIPLERLAQDTGALYLLAPEPGALQDLYRQLAQQFRGQYKMVYQSPGAGEAGEEHHLALTIQINGVAYESSKGFQVP